MLVLLVMLALLVMPFWLHETLALTGVGIAAAWLVVRLVQIGRPRSAGCARCAHAGSPASPPTPTGIRSARLRVLG